MSRQEEPRVTPELAMRHYMLLALLSLGVALLALMQILQPDGLAQWGVLPIILGVVSVVFRWRVGPILVLVALGILLYVDRLSLEFSTLGAATDQRSVLAMWVLSGGLLGYCAAHFRLIGLTTSLLPPDPRRFEEPEEASTVKPPAPVAAGRPVSSWEIGGLVLALPIWAFLAQLVARLLPTRSNIYHVPAEVWQGILLAWALTIGILVVASLLSYLGRQLMTRRQALLYLQDILWLQTRRDQRRVQRWLLWHKLRRRRKEHS